MGGEADELAAPGILSASWSAPTPPPVASCASPTGPVAAAGERLPVAASPSSTMANNVGKGEPSRGSYQGTIIIITMDRTLALAKVVTAVSPPTSYV